jgi:hypothetical protein
MLADYPSFGDSRRVNTTSSSLTFRILAVHNSWFESNEGMTGRHERDSFSTVSADDR